MYDCQCEKHERAISKVRETSAHQKSKWVDGTYSVVEVSGKARTQRTQTSSTYSSSNSAAGMRSCVFLCTVPLSTQTCTTHVKTCGSRWQTAVVQPSSRGAPDANLRPYYYLFLRFISFVNVSQRPPLCCCSRSIFLHTAPWRICMHVETPGAHMLKYCLPRTHRVCV